LRGEKKEKKKNIKKTAMAEGSGPQAGSGPEEATCERKRGTF